MKKQIKSFEDACKATGRNPEDLPRVDHLDPDMSKGVIAHYKLMVICEAIRGNWKPDFSNVSEYKWYPWFYYKKENAGFAFSLSRYALTFTAAAVGSRLCFKTEAQADYAGRQFAELYNEYYLYQ